MKDFGYYLSIFFTLSFFMLSSIMVENLNGSDIPDYTEHQTYLGEPPPGMNAQYAWQFPDGKGDGITIVDIEFGWNWDHVDLINASANTGSNNNENHGTAVMGILVAEENGFGITGFAPHAQVYGIAQGDDDPDITSAINAAVSYLDQHGQPGDIILIEFSVSALYNQQLYEEMPVEFFPMANPGIHNREAIEYAINEGYVVVEAAGNDRNNLDDVFPPYYTHAIMVAGADISNGSIGGDSNYGERIDANGWAYDIYTCGYGHKYEGDGPDEYYTDDFGETSGAAAMVAGATAILQAINKHFKGDYLRSYQIQDLYRYQELGYPPNFGNRPNLKKLISELEIPTTVHIDQVDEYDVSFGTQGIEMGIYMDDEWENNPIPDDIDDYNLADQVPFRSYQGLVESSSPSLRHLKFHHWNNVEDGLYINFHIFDFLPQLNNIIGRFNPVYDGITVRTKLISAGDDDSGEIEFKDPWLIDFESSTYGMRNRGMKSNGIDALRFWTRSSPFHPDYDTPYGPEQYKYRGAFLDQPYTGDNPVFYSVRAPEPQTIPFHGQDIDWYFQGWGGASNEVSYQYPDQTETAVVFKTPDATAIANYKGHLVSSNETATASNNGCRTVRDAAGSLHLVYEDNGQIYYTWSPDNGQSWNPEIKLSGLSNENHYPTICRERDFPERIIVIWERVDGEENHGLSYRFKFIGSTEWFDETNMTGVTSENSIQPAALFKYISSVHRYDLFVIANYAYLFDENQLRISRYRFEFIPFGTSRFIQVDDYPVTGTNAYSVEPAIAASVSVANWDDNTIYMVWSQRDDMEGHIYYSFLNLSGAPAFGGYQNISVTPYCWDVYHCQYVRNITPSIAIDNDDMIQVVWDAWENPSTSNVILHRQKSINDGYWYPYTHIFTEIFSSSYYDLETPTIGAYTYQYEPGRVNIAFVRDPYIIYVIQHTGTSWQWLTPVVGHNPSMSGVGWNDQTGDLNLVWTDDHQGLPYLLSHSAIAIEEDKGVEEFREEVFELSELSGLNAKGRVSLSMGKLKIQTDVDPIDCQFLSSPNSLPGKSFLETEPIRISSKMKTIDFSYQAEIKGFNKPAQLLQIPFFRLQVIDKSNNSVLATIKNFEFSQINDTTFILNDAYSLDLKPYESRLISLRMNHVYNLFANPGQTSLRIAKIAPPSVQSLPKENKLSSSAELIPIEFSLTQNYPNPFNPMTNITYNLPEEAMVSLFIYDITGRQIKALTSSRYPAGTHQIQWDGRDDFGNAVATGIYVYRIQAGNYVQSKKMMLLK